LTWNWQITVPESGRARRLLLQLTDTVVFYSCLDKWKAEFLERQLIRVFKPPFNRRL